MPEQLVGVNGEPLPPPEEIVPARGERGALYRLHTPMVSAALPWVMPYAFVSRDGVTLFDAGYGTPEAVEALTHQLATLDRKPSDVRRLIVSHGHADHVGMAHWLREQSPDMELILQQREATSYWRDHQGGKRWESQMAGWGVTHGFPAEEVDGQSRDRDHSHRQGRDAIRRAWDSPHVEPTREVEDGDEIAFDGWILTAVHTPGHTAGHLCIHIPDEQLTFTGDHVLSRITPNVSYGPEDDAQGRDPLAEFLASLRKVAALDTRLALPAHERLITDLPARCRDIIEHHAHRADEVFHGIGDHEGGATAFQVASRVTWNRPWSTFPIWKQHSAVGETLSHLRYMEQDGRVRRVQDDDGVVHWLRAR